VVSTGTEVIGCMYVECNDEGRERRREKGKMNELRYGSSAPRRARTSFFLTSLMMLLLHPPRIYVIRLPYVLVLA